MRTILIDHNIEGQATILWGTLEAAGWLELFTLQMKTLADAGLPVGSSDRDVWRFVQANEMILVTDNRNMKGKDSLEQTIREENTTTSLPVLTIGNVRRMVEKTYRKKSCFGLVYKYSFYLLFSLIEISFYKRKFDCSEAKNSLSRFRVWYSSNI